MAKGCLASNLAVPGVGSLAGGHKVGLFQLGLCLAGFGLTLGSGLRFIFWTLAHWEEYYGPNPPSDPMKPLFDLWVHARWPLLGMALFACAWLWALSTSLAMLAETKKQEG
jgi:hypothetical protein